jgi:hypothetical protein
VRPDSFPHGFQHRVQVGLKDREVLFIPEAARRPDSY